MKTFGIDLGTTYSCIAFVDDSGRARVIRNTQGEETTPSVVYFESPDNVVVGQYAKNVSRLEPQSVVSLIKREMGHDWQREFHGYTHTPETVSALILRELAGYASQETQETVNDVVITVPAYFGVAEREATRTAGNIAGLNVLNVISEPVAAALHYEATGAGEDRTILVFDLGGGTFDTTVIKLTGDDIHTVCTDGDKNLGGADWDQKIVDFLLDLFMDENPDSEARASDEFVQELSIAAEDIKKSLSTMQSRRFPLRFGRDVCRAEVTRAEFEGFTAELLARARDITERTLETARKAGIDRFDDVLLVGGSSRMPGVSAMLQERFGLSPRLHDPEQAVARGAAHFALIESIKDMFPDEPEGGAPSAATEEAVREAADRFGLMADKVRMLKEKSVTAVVPRAFGVKVMIEIEDGTQKSMRKHLISHILEANRPLPAAPEKQQYYTADPDMTSIVIEIWEQAGSVASSDLADNTKIGEGVISDLPALPKGSPIDVTFTMNDTGVLKVEAEELRTHKKLKFDLRIRGLSGGQLQEAKDAVSGYDVRE
jgi:molecular chaperone DnaK (HSP70)